MLDLPLIECYGYDNEVAFRTRSSKADFNFQFLAIGY